MENLEGKSWQRMMQAFRKQANVRISFCGLRVKLECTCGNRKETVGLNGIDLTGNMWIDSKF